MENMETIKRLRRKIIGVTLTSVSSVLIVMAAAINGYNFIRTANNADRTLKVIAKNGGRFGTNGKDNLEEGGDSVELPHTTRYFTYAFEGDTPKEIVFQISFFTKEKAKDIAITIRKGNSSKGWIEGTYRYKKYNINGSDYVTLIDQSRELAPSFRVLWASIIGSLVSVLVIFLILLPISNLMVKPIERNIAKQKRFISDASHELKTPLAIIALNNDIEVAEHGESENATNISKQVKQLTRMANNLNELAKLDEDEKITFVSFNLTDLANDVLSSFRGIANQYKKSLNYEIEENLTYVGNPDKIRRLLSILLDNAVKYSKSCLSFKVSSSNKNIIIKVENDTNGIPEGNLNVVFERFYRLEEARSSDVSGSGIGLSMAKEIVSLHHGEISAKGENGIFKINVKL